MNLRTRRGKNRFRNNAWRLFSIPPTLLVVSVESIRSLTDLAPTGLDSPMSGVSALTSIPPDSTLLSVFSFPILHLFSSRRRGRLVLHPLPCRHLHADSGLGLTNHDRIAPHPIRNSARFGPRSGHSLVPSSTISQAISHLSSLAS